MGNSRISRLIKLNQRHNVSLSPYLGIKVTSDPLILYEVNSFEEDRARAAELANSHSDLVLPM